MISTQLFWIDGPWPGRLALAARPRGGEWLEEEMTAWRQEGVNAVISLLTADEEVDLELGNESREAQDHGITFRSFPIKDRQVPSSPSELAKFLEAVEADLKAGQNTVVHCRQGVGRSGLVGACLFIAKGMDAQSAIDRISAARGVAIPETAEQRHWIDFYAGSLAATQ